MCVQDKEIGYTDMFLVQQSMINHTSFGRSLQIVDRLVAK